MLAFVAGGEGSQLSQLISENPASAEVCRGRFRQRRAGSKKDVVEHCSAIDTASLKRWKLLVPGITGRAGSFEWRRGGEEKPSSAVSYLLTVGPSTGTLRLMYSMTSQNADFDYAVRLVTTPCHLGGTRWWFICPLTKTGVACGRRVRKVYLCGKYFGCRHCHGLTYRSTQESDSRVYAALHQGCHLGGHGNIEGMSVARLGLTLKLLAAGQKRLDRICKRLDRGKKATGAAEDS